VSHTVAAGGWVAAAPRLSSQLGGRGCSSFVEFLSLASPSGRGERRWPSRPQVFCLSLTRGQQVSFPPWGKRDRIAEVQRPWRKSAATPLVVGGSRDEMPHILTSYLACRRVASSMCQQSARPSGPRMGRRVCVCVCVCGRAPTEVMPPCVGAPVQYRLASIDRVGLSTGWLVCG
jgi:hypothetical protein